MQDIDLAAVFERDSYTLTLEGELTASYQTVDPNDTSKTLTKSLKSGESVTGDTKITVAPKAGYAAATGETYQVNGKAVEAGKLNADGSYTFPITENKVSAQDRPCRICDYHTGNGAWHNHCNRRRRSQWTICSRFPAAARLSCRHAQTAAGNFKNWVVNGTARDEAAAKTNGTLHHQRTGRQSVHQR